MNVNSKLRNGIHIAIVFSLIIFCNPDYISSQSNVSNKYGLDVVSNPQIFKNNIALDAMEKYGFVQLTTEW